MRDLSYLDEYRIETSFGKGDQHSGIFEIKLPHSLLTFRIVASNGGGWEHVSVSTSERIPRWSDMQHIKEMFFEDEEAVIQIHPRKSEYINMHPYCLHMWRPISETLPLPPTWMIGV